VTLQFPVPVAAYFLATNRHDIDSMVLPIAADAIVHDEGGEPVGHVAIRAWMVETKSKYRVAVESQEAQESGDRTAVAGLVSGNFPGSSAILHYGFSHSPAEIHRLEIG
jgi:hypothetical protein